MKQYLFIFIFTLNFNLYGLLIGSGIVLILWYVDTKLKLKFIDYLQILISALLGARFIYILHNPSQILQFLNFQSGGLAFFGALFGGLISIFFISKRRNIQFLDITDNILFLAPIAQSLGRIGNFFNHEIFGYPTNLPWKIFIPLENRPTGYENYAYYQPTFAYEIILNLINFFILTRIKNRRIRGLVTSSYLIIYGIIRLFMNRLRIEGEYFFSIETSDISSTIIIIFGIFLLINIMSEASKKKFAEIISVVLSPFTLILIPFFLFPLFHPLSEHKEIIYLLTGILVGSTPVLQYLVFKKLKLVADWNVPDRKDRPFYTTVTATLFLIGYAISYFTKDPEFQIISLSIAIIMYIFAFISLFWKISGHLAFLTFTLTMSYLIINNNYVLLFFFLIPILIWSRLYLKHHDIYQTIGGSILGIVVPYVIWILIH